MIRPRAYVNFAAAVLAVGVLASVDGAQHRQTFAPHELGNSDGPAPIIWPTPELLKRSFDIESAEERRLKVVVVAKGLEQPWSVAFVPDGSMLVTERVGRLRIVRDGKLEESPVAGVPRVQTGGPRGLQGLMDVVSIRSSTETAGSISPITSRSETAPVQLRWPAQPGTATRW